MQTRYELHVEYINADSQGSVGKWHWCLWQESVGTDKYYDLDIDNISAGALKVAAQVNACEQTLANPDALAAFRYMFANANVMGKGNNSRPAWVRFDDTEEKPDALRAAAVFYQGIYLYLREDDRYSSLNADLALLLSAWQWYTAYSRIVINNTSEKPATMDLYQYGQAHKTLAALLEDHQFDLAAQWLAFLRSSSGDLPLARERFRTAMVLEYFPAHHKEKRSLHHALAAPGAFEPVEWGNTRLLPILFSNDGGKALVRRLISEWLLARYDFRTSLHLAHLLKHNRPQRHLFQGWVMLAWLVVWTCGMLALNWLLQPDPSTFSSSHAIGYSAALFGFGPLVLGLMAWSGFEPGALVNLALPRLSGGIALGYVAFILQKDAIDLALRFWEPNPFPLVCLWVGALALGIIYLYFDVLPRARTSGETRARVCSTLAAGVLISMGMGLFTVALSTAAYQGCDQPFGCFLGPFGWISWQQWWALVPLALTTGLVTQFVLEERTVTAPVWSSDES